MRHPGLVCTLTALVGIAACGGGDDQAAAPATTAERQSPRFAELPDAVAGRFQRRVTEADVDAVPGAKTTAAGGLPLGRFRLVQQKDGTGYVKLSDGGMEALSIKNTDDASRFEVSGGFCDQIDPALYRIEPAGDGIALEPISGEECPDRQAALVGTWTRTG